jgi:hypothetical protein
VLIAGSPTRWPADDRRWATVSSATPAQRVGHWIHRDDPDGWVAAVRAFFERVATTPLLLVTDRSVAREVAW